MRRLIYFMIAILLPTLVFADPPDTLWTKTFGGENADFGRKVLQTTDGGFATLGFTNSYTYGGSDIYLIKTDADGDTLWTNHYGGASDDTPGGFCLTGDGGFLIAGTTFSFGAIIADVYLIRTDADGDTLWTKMISGNDDDICEDVCSTSDGGYILAGYSSSTGTAGAYDALLIKIDSEGNVLWSQLYGGESSDKIYTVQQTTDGGFIAAGESGSYVLYDQEAYLIRTDAAGDTVWTRYFGMPYYYLHDVFKDVMETSDGGFIALGSSCSFSFGYYDIYIVQTDANGDSVWTKTIGGIWDDTGLGFAPTTDGDYIIAGTTKWVEGPYSDAYLVKITGSGDTTWTCSFGDPAEDHDDFFYSVIQTSDGKYVAAGETDSFGAGAYDAWLICLETDIVGVSSKNVPLPQECILYDPFPNPFNNAVKIGFQLQHPGNITLTLRDVIGRKIRVLADGWHAAGEAAISFDADGLPSGIYIAELETNNFTTSKKLILLK